MSYVSEVLADAPSVFLKLDDATTTFADSSGNSHTQTYSAAITPNQPALRSGITKSVLMGGGSITEDFGSATSYTDLTVEAWYKSTVGTGAIWTSRGASGNGLTLFIGATGAAFGVTGQISFGLDGAGVYTGVSTSGTYNDGIPHHIVGVYSRASGVVVTTDFQLYVDGTLLTTTPQSISQTSAPVTPTNNWVIGQHLGGWANGTLTSTNLAMMALYPSALSASRAYTHYAAAGSSLAQPIWLYH